MLTDKKAKDKRITKTKKMTFSKKAMTAILIVSLIDIQLPFVLAWFGKTDIESLTTIAVALVTEVISCWLIYALKSFFETKEEERMTIERERLGFTSQDCEINEEEETL